MKRKNGEEVSPSVLPTKRNKKVSSSVCGRKI
jgi:hypothetical protein